jgi:hypothetical protein
MKLLRQKGFSSNSFTAVGGEALYNKKKEQEKQYSLFGDIVRDAIKGMASEIYKNNGGGNTSDTNIVFGTLVLSRFIDVSRYLGKEVTYTVEPSLEVSAQQGGSIISWDLSERFCKFKNCPNNWESFVITGEAEKGKYLDARIITKQGKVLTGKVLVEVK